jgi:hypothetical protein
VKRFAERCKNLALQKSHGLKHSARGIGPILATGWPLLLSDERSEKEGS